MNQSEAERVLQIIELPGADWGWGGGLKDLQGEKI